MKLTQLFYLSLALLFTGCATMGGPDDPSITPRSSMDQCRQVDEYFDGFECVEVFYGTNRNREKVLPLNPREPEDRGDIFGILADPSCEPKYRPELMADGQPLTPDPREELCHLGSLAISIPTKRDNDIARGRGSYDEADPGQDLLDEDLKKLFAILGEEKLDPDSFSDKIRATLNDASKMPNTAFIFVHGFNVPFRSAAFRTAQIKHDLDFDGPAMFYSWPANGSATDYLNDLEDADLSVDGLAAFLRYAHEELKAEQPDATIHIIAHSMGSRVTARALLKLSREPNPPAFGELIVAHGDLDSALFKEWTGDYKSLTEGISLYTTSSDEAVLLSTILRNFKTFFGTKRKGKVIDHKPRIGFFRKKDAPEVFAFLDDVDEGGFTIDTIDITENGRRSFWSYFNPGTWFRRGHDTYAANVRLVQDMGVLFTQKTRQRPHDRDEAFVKVCTGSEAYWVFLPDGKSKRKSFACAD